jgi:hypothetical protein
LSDFIQLRSGAPHNWQGERKAVTDEKVQNLPHNAKSIQRRAKDATAKTQKTVLNKGTFGFFGHDAAFLLSIASRTARFGTPIVPSST